jgi:dTDP-4-dehydrorhamnose 3,5-epimerase
MIFQETRLGGCFLVQIETYDDDRGFFALAWSAGEFAKRGLEARLMECNISFNIKKGTLRGMHYQEAPHGQTKIVRCTQGSIYDAVVDLRPGSPTFRQWAGFELSAENRLLLYVPKGFAHGFQTLEDKTEVFYQMSEVFTPESGRGVRWNDPQFGVVWPEMPRVISERDRTYPDFVSAPTGKGSA